MANRKEQQELLEHEQATESSGPVECLGTTFESDEARRTHFLERLKEKLRDPAFRALEGFPIGSDDPILWLSDPPYSTLCPNPFFETAVKELGHPYLPETDEYRREPFSADVTEGKNDPVYNAHSYHTKVPPKAILRYLLHYTEPGDLVLDGFAGTGMTGVAAALCGTKSIIESLGFSVREDGEIFDQGGARVSAVGHRYALLTDLAPIAAFISSSLCSPVSSSDFANEAAAVAKAAQEEIGRIYRTRHTSGRGDGYGSVLYGVWSDVLICSECSSEILAWDVVVDRESKRMRGEFDCPSCSAHLKRRLLDRAIETTLDPLTNQPHKHTRQQLVLIHYKVGKQRYVKAPDAEDVAIQDECLALLRHYTVPTATFEHTARHFKDGNHLRGITHSHHYYTPRNLLVLACLLKHVRQSRFPREMMFVLTGFLEGHANRRNRYILDRHHPEGTTCGPLTNTLFVPELQCEVNLFNAWTKTVKKQSKAQARRIPRTYFAEVGSATSLRIRENTVDYIFVDPPFGKNILYSDLNLLWEAWLGVRTRPEKEAIVNDVQGKDLLKYGELMRESFREFYRVLKPGRWMTLEFHNSLNAVWSAIQEALERAGFTIADVRVLDKKHGTIHQDSGYTVKKDLIVSAYKPNGGLEERFKLEAGTESGAWDFTRTHLRQLPVFVQTPGARMAEPILERQPHMLFDRMVAFHVQRGVTVPLSAAEFHEGLVRRFSERDGMYFLPEQVAEYDRKRMTVQEVLQLELFVKDEETAIQWLKQQLTKKPQTFQEIHPQFMKELGGWGKHERSLELSELLEQNFLRYAGAGEVPSQIHTYLSSNFKELRSLEKHDPALRAKAKDRWYVPDPRKAGDLEKLRDRTLLKEFEEYRDSSQKKLKVFRLEAVRAGFRRAWQERDYAAIITVARKIPENVLQEDPKLLMWFDQALTRSGEDA